METGIHLNFILILLSLLVSVFLHMQNFKTYLLKYYPNGFACVFYPYKTEELVGFVLSHLIEYLHEKMKKLFSRLIHTL